MIETKNELKSYLTSNGYVIRKECLSKSEICMIYKDLNVQPFESTAFIVQKFGSLPPKMKVYQENDKKFYLPRFYGIEKFGQADGSFLDDNVVEIAIPFSGDLKEKQKEILDVFIPAIRLKGGGIMNLSCGIGKTVLAIKCITELKVKTLVLCHKSFLVDQWIERIKQFTPLAKIGVIKQSNVMVENCDIVIGMIQSICSRDYHENTFKGFGLTVIDECHHMSANVFSQAFRKVSSKYMIGLSATLERKDGLERVFHWYLGNPEYSLLSRDDIGEVFVEVVVYIEKRKEFYTPVLNARGLTDNIDLINKICVSNDRTSLIVGEIEKHYDAGRNILVVSERRAHCIDISKRLREDISFGFFVGGMTAKQTLDASTKRVLIATYQFTSEGMDRADLDTLILGTPKGDVVQTTGRVLRKSSCDMIRSPLIIDIHDKKIKQYEKRLKLRKQHYNANGYIVSERTYVQN
jgi:superfamily II DNA or RNA helicase